MLYKWFIFYTGPKAEKFLKNELEKENYEVCLPLQKVHRQWKDRKKILDIPLFPNYIFVKTAKENIYHILHFPKIVKYVAFDGRPATLGEEEIKFINKACQYNNVTFLSELRKGDKIRINSGILKGYEGILIEADGKKWFGLQLKEFKKIVYINIEKNIFVKI